MKQSTFTTTRIAKVPYLNCAPFFVGWPAAAHTEFIDYVPRKLGKMAAAGDVVAGPMSLMDFFRLEDQFERLGHFGIAVRGRAQSAILFSLQPLRQMGSQTITVSEETSTTYCMLRLIMEVNYQLPQASFKRGSHTDAEGLLLIGDEALRFQKTNKRYPFETDIAFEWWLWQHLPAVFAVWAIRKDASEDTKRDVERALGYTLGNNLAQIEKIATDASPALGMSPDELKVYLDQFVYRLGPEEEEGINKFKALVNEYHLL